MKQPKLKASRSAMEMPLMPRFLGNGKSMLKSPSVTKQEIAKFWKQKRMVEEDHLSAAIKAAARKRAQNLSEHDYWQFESSLTENDECDKDNNKGYRNNEELQGIIKDWWMKSEHSYLNEPIIDLFDNPRRRYATYTPQIWCDKFNAHQYMNFTGGIYIGQMRWNFVKVPALDVVAVICCHMAAGSTYQSPCCCVVAPGHATTALEF